MICSLSSSFLHYHPFSFHPFSLHPFPSILVLLHPLPWSFNLRIPSTSRPCKFRKKWVRSFCAFFLSLTLSLSLSHWLSYLKRFSSQNIRGWMTMNTRVIWQVSGDLLSVKVSNDTSNGTKDHHSDLALFPSHCPSMAHIFWAATHWSWWGVWRHYDLQWKLAGRNIRNNILCGCKPVSLLPGSTDHHHGLLPSNMAQGMETKHSRSWRSQWHENREKSQPSNGHVDAKI